MKRTVKDTFWPASRKRHEGKVRDLAAPCHGIVPWGDTSCTPSVGTLSCLRQPGMVGVACAHSACFFGRTLTVSKSAKSVVNMI